MIFLSTFFNILRYDQYMLKVSNNSSLVSNSSKKNFDMVLDCFEFFVDDFHHTVWPRLVRQSVSKIYRTKWIRTKWGFFLVIDVKKISKNRTKPRISH